MLTPARPEAPAEPTAVGTNSRLRGAVLASGLLAVLACVLFPFAPVGQPEVRYSWTASDGPAAIPLMPYQPVELTATTSCATVRDNDGRVLLSTVPPVHDPAAVPLSGLTLTSSDGGVEVLSGGVELGTAALPAGNCDLSVASGVGSTVLLVDGAPVLSRDGDVRPDVAGAFSEVSSGVGLTLVTDTRFQTTMSPLKAAVGAVGALALLAMLVAVGRADRVAAVRVRLLPRGGWRPRPVDAAVTATLGLWWVVGPATVDDGYISGIVRSSDRNGFVGNVYRWLNAPESPFSWFYELYHLWSLVSTATVWMRLPATLLGLLCWWLLSRLVLPRLGRFATRRWTPWLAALAFTSWWVPLNLGLRPEPWVAVGALGVFLAVERALATRAVVPLLVGLVLAGATTALTPGGLLAFAPFLAAAVPVLRLVRARADLHVLPLVVALAAAPASAALLMVYDQSFAGMLEAVRVRSVIGGGLPWYQEYERYSRLLEPASLQGSIGRRAAVLLTLLAAAALWWNLRIPRSGVAAGPARRLVLGFLLALVVMTFTPTKWTQHFGDLAGYGAAVLVLGLVTWSAAPLRQRPGRFVAGLGAATAVGSLVLAGYNTWPYAGNWFAPTFSTLPPQVLGAPVATIALVAGAAVVIGLAGRSAWRRSGGADAGAVPRAVPGPVALVAGVLVVVLALQVLALTRTAVEHRDSYTYASDAVATLRGQPCGLQRLLSVETDPAAGLLAPVAPPERPAPAVPVDVGGPLLPGVTVAGTATTAWFGLDPAQRDGSLPVVVTVSGSARPGDGLFVEFAAGERILDRRGITPVSAEPRDSRQLAPGGADRVRLVIDAPAAGARAPAVASLPRVPRLTPMTEVLPDGSTAILDWPVAFVFPCLRPEPLPLGTAALARWRVGPPAADPAAGITYAPGFGGPFAAPRLLVTEQRMATYLRGDPLRDAAQLYRWVPNGPLARPGPAVTDRTVAGWERSGHARVPGLDPVG